MDRHCNGFPPPPFSSVFRTMRIYDEFNYLISVGLIGLIYIFIFLLSAQEGSLILHAAALVNLSTSHLYSWNKSQCFDLECRAIASLLCFESEEISTCAVFSSCRSRAMRARYLGSLALLVQRVLAQSTHSPFCYLRYLR